MGHPRVPFQKSQCPTPSAPRRLDINLNKRPDSDLTALHWNAEGTRLAIGSCDSILRGLLRAVFPALSAPAPRLCCQNLATWKVAAYGQSGLHRLSVGREMKARKRNMQYRAHTDCCLDEPVKTFPRHTYEMDRIRCNPSGTRLASCSDDMTARIWTVDAICAPSTGESSMF
ncbi:hypothetical protein B0H14DRAFT_1661558 [Mycena olivaceomarginata]|nr:hypothetical protein B0H14DRAFT_1661558 [Mycena olivaceomarginata]